MNTFKDPLYWSLMPPFFIAAIVSFYYLPASFAYISFLVILLFWVVYYAIRHFRPLYKK